MIFTVDLSDGTSGATDCLTDYGLASSVKTQAYAQYNSASTLWEVKYHGTYTDCPKIFEDMQAPSIMHRGLGNYKVYYGTPADTTGKNASCMAPWLGPKRMMFADAAATSSTSSVEYEDWEGKATQREMQFAWPDGSILSARAEGYIDDFEFMGKPGNLLSQHAYLSITDGSNSCAAPFITYATLVNP